jgi:hypothetical protein
MPEGEGGMACADGRKFDGQFHNGVCHGFATLQCEVMSILCCYDRLLTALYMKKGQSRIAMATGTWSEGYLNGHATVLYSNQDKYIGEFARDRREGFGVITYSNGSTYHGGWSGDARQGYGVLRTSKLRYLGMWYQDEKHGPGRLMLIRVELRALKCMGRAARGRSGSNAWNLQSRQIDWHCVHGDQ